MTGLLAIRPAAEPPRHVTKAELIAETIRKEILTGVLRPGDKLMLDEQASRFGGSAIPVREALRALEADRLVESRPHRTAVVRGVSLEEQEDLYAVRLVIEAEAVRRATQRLSAGEIDALRALAVEHEDALRRGVPRRPGVHQEFHFRIYQGAASPTLVRITTDLWQQSERCRLVMRATAARWSGRHDADHVALVDAIASRDPDQAADTLRRHLARSIAVLRGTFAAAAAAQS